MHESSAKIQLAAGVAAFLFALADLRLPLAAALGSIAAILASQLWSWKPWAIRSQPLLWILYFGYAGVGAGLATACFHALGSSSAPPFTRT